MIDLHTHHDRCGHAEGSLGDMARWALAHGIRMLGVSDHAPRFAEAADHPRPLVQMARSQWDGYLAEAVALRGELAGRLDLRVGVEADFLPGTEAAYRAALDRPELDYVVGSVHEVAVVGAADGSMWNLFAPDSYADADIDDVHRAYWRTVAAAAGSGLFDVLGHLDLIRMLPPARADLREVVEQTCEAVADAGVAVEINGSGLRRDGRPYPDAPLLAGLVRRGVPITFGSDAHRREQLGQGWDEASTLLSGLGVGRWATFRGRALSWWSEGERARVGRAV
jgi:histidinol-phosphatase (PHP family)